MLRLVSCVTFLALLVVGIEDVGAQPETDSTAPSPATGSGSGTPAGDTGSPAPFVIDTAEPPTPPTPSKVPPPIPAARPHRFLLLPDITLKGDNNGPAKATLGLTASVAHGNDTDLSFGAAFSAKTQDGAAQLIGIDGSGVHPTDFGGEVSFANISLEPLGSVLAFQLRLAQEQWDACEMDCSHSDSPKTSFCAAVHPDYYTDRKAIANAQQILNDAGMGGWTLKRGNLVPAPLWCSAAKKVWDDATTAATSPTSRDLRAASPTQVISVAGRIGYTTYKWIAAESTAGELAKGEEHDWSESLGARWMRRRGWLTGEAFGAISHGYVASTTTAKWCTPAGNVPRPDKSGSDAAETCRESPLGAPVGGTTMQFGVFGGYFDEAHALFRVTLGGIVKLTVPDSDGKNTTFEAGGALPIYFNTNLMPDEKGVFKGIVRLTPRLVLTRDEDGKKAVQFLVSLELLTGRSMFPMASDLL